MAALLFGALAVSAAVSTVTKGDFSGDETVITFEEIGQDEEITTQFAGDGVTFSGGLFGDLGAASLFTASDPGLVTGCNFSSTVTSFPDITVDFDSSVTMAGFDIITNGGDDTTITVSKLSGGSPVPTGSATFATTIPDTFIGVGDPDGFDSLLIEVSDNVNGAACINDLRFEGVGNKVDILSEFGPGKGLSDAPGLQKEFNPKSKAADNAGKKK